MRVLELAKLGFERVIIPDLAPNLGLSPADLGGLQVIRKPTLRSALEYCFGAENLKRAGRAPVEKRAGRQQQQQGGWIGRGRRSSSRSS